MAEPPRSKQLAPKKESKKAAGAAEVAAEPRRSKRLAPAGAKGGEKKKRA
jgi:hypothetical protein